MKRSEALTKYSDIISAALIDHYRIVLDSRGRIQYRIYIYDDGELACIECVQSDSSFLRKPEHETRELFYVCTVCSRYINPDEDVESLMDDYQSGIVETLDAIIEDAERAEKYE